MVSVKLHPAYNHHSSAPSVPGEETKRRDRGGETERREKSAKEVQREEKRENQRISMRIDLGLEFL